MQETKPDNAGKTGENSADGMVNRAAKGADAGNGANAEMDVTGGQTASFGQTMKAVLWSFLGIRKRRDHDQQTAKLNPVHVVIAALLGVGLFIFALLMIVKSVVAK